MGRTPGIAAIVAAQIQAIIAQYMGFNYGEARVSVAQDGVPQIEITCRDADGVERYREVLRADELALTAPAALAPGGAGAPSGP